MLGMNTYLLSSLLQKAPVSGVPVPEVARVELAVAIVALVVDRISVPLLPPVREQFRAEQHGAKHRELTKMIRKNPELVMKKMKRCNNYWLNCYPWFELQRYIKCYFKCILKGNRNGFSAPNTSEIGGFCSMKCSIREILKVKI